MPGNPTIALRSARCFGGLMLATLFAILSLGAGSARAEYGLQSFSTSFHDSTGAPFTQAAGHPDLTVEFRINETTDAQGNLLDDGQTHTVVTDLPKGFYGNPQAVPQCPRTLLAPGNEVGLCPPDSQIGTLGLSLPGQGPDEFLHIALFNMAPGPNEAAVFGANVLTSPVGLVSVVTLEDGAPKIRTTLRNNSQGINFLGTRLVLWAVPPIPRTIRNAQKPAAGPAACSRSHS